MKKTKLISRKLAIIALTISTICGAFFVSPNMVYASEGNGGISVEVPQGWQNKAVTLQVKVEDYVIYDDKNKEIPVTAKKVNVAIDDGKYQDITDSMIVTIDHNCKLKLQVIYTDGGSASESYDIQNFDLELPTIQTSVTGETLYLKAEDQISGVADINVNGKAYAELNEGQMCVNIKDLESTDEFITIYADDKAGNKSKQFKIKNPYFVGEIESGSTDQGIGNPDSVEPTDPTNARGTVSDNTTTTEDGEVTKEFYTVEASGKTFYLIVDKTQTQDNVYLLTEAGVNDLLNFVDYDGVDVQNGAVPMYEIPSTGGKTTESGEQEIAEDEEIKEEEPSKSNSGSMFIIVLLICGVGIGYYFIRNKRRKDDLAEAEEMDAFDTPDEELIEVEIGDTEDEDEYEDVDETESSDSLYTDVYKENEYDEIHFTDEGQSYETDNQ